MPDEVHLVYMKDLIIPLQKSLQGVLFGEEKQKKMLYLRILREIVHTYNEYCLLYYSIYICTGGKNNYSNAVLLFVLRPRSPKYPWSQGKTKELIVNSIHL